LKGTSPGLGDNLGDLRDLVASFIEGDAVEVGFATATADDVFSMLSDMLDERLS